MALGEIKLENLPRYAQILLVAVVAFALLALFYVFYLKGALEQRDTLRTEIRKLEKSVAEAAAVASQLERFKKELAQLEERLSVLRSILPAEKETPMVLRSVQQMAVSSNLKIMRFIPSPTVPRAFYVDWPISLEVQGSYNGLGLFFEKISQFTRIINADNISVKAVEGSTDPARTLTATCTATTFVFRENEVVENTTANAKKKK
jgi:type IV pilus assembly protein PilO